jgi:hypothetical protein
MTVDVDGAQFSFAEDWHTLKYDDSRFYRDVFSRVHDGLAAVDIVAIQHDSDSGIDKRVVLIEVKDYRHPNIQTKRPSALVEEVLRKVTSTLSGLSVASRRAADPTEQSLATRSQGSVQVHVIVHCENPAIPVVDPSELAIKLSARLKPIVDFVSVGTEKKPAGPWSVQMPEV